MNCTTESVIYVMELAGYGMSAYRLSLIHILYESQGIARKEAMKLVAKDRGISKRDVYQALLS